VESADDRRLHAMLVRRAS